MFSIGLDITVGDWNVRMEFLPFHWVWRQTTRVLNGNNLYDLKLTKVTEHIGPIQITFTNKSLESQYTGKFMDRRSYTAFG